MIRDGLGRLWRRPWRWIALACLVASPTLAQQAPVWLSPDRQLRYQPRSKAEAVSQLRSLTREQRRARGADTKSRSEARSMVRPASLPIDGTWLELGPPSREGHSLIYDTRRDRVVAVGGGPLHPGAVAWALPLADPAAWERLRSGAPAFDEGSSVVAVRDSLLDRVLAYERRVDGGGAIWELRLGRSAGWTRVVNAGVAPGGLSAAGLAWDEDRRRLILVTSATFGGPGEVWVLEFTASPVWSLTPMSGDPPPVGADVSVVYDRRRDTIICTSGGFLYQGHLSDVPTWESDPGDEYLAGGSSRLLIDEAQDVLVRVDDRSNVQLHPLAGGTDSLYLDASGFRARGAAVAIDPTRRLLVLHGGWDDVSGEARSGVRRIALDSLTHWTPLGPRSSGGRVWHQAAVDPVRDRLLVQGGWIDSTQGVVVGRSVIDDAAGFAALEFAPGPAPRARYGNSWVYDSKGDRLLMYGGQATDGTGDYLGDVWALTLGEPPAWTELSPLGTLPGPRRFHGAFYDPVRDRMLVLGGDDGVSALETVYELAFDPVTEWRQLDTTGTSIAGSAVSWLDPEADRALAFAYPGRFVSLGFDSSRIVFHELPPAGDPLPAGFTPLIYDPARGRIVGFAPTLPFLTRDDHSEVVAVVIGAGIDWTRYACVGLFPVARILEAAVHDRNRDRMLVCGGYDDDLHYFDDTWALSWDEPVPVAATAFVAVYREGLVYLEWWVPDPSPRFGIERREGAGPWVSQGDARVGLDGRLHWEDGSVVPGRSYTYRLAPPAGSASARIGEVTVLVPSLEAELRLSVETAAGDLRVSFALAGPSPGTLEAFDIAGRRVARRAVTEPHGDRVLLARGSDLNPGVYLIRLSQAARAVHVKAVWAPD